MVYWNREIDRERHAAEGKGRIRTRARSGEASAYMVCTLIQRAGGACYLFALYYLLGPQLCPQERSPRTQL